MSQAQDSVSPVGLRNNYHRPNQKWECGNLNHGCPCAHGPSPGGKCLSNTECSPIKEADTWLCTRPTFRGGTCDNGPDQHGNCCQSRPPCTPKRSLRYRRKMFSIGFAIATFGLFLVLLGSWPMQEIIVPGPLSSGHGELLMHQGADRCASCHANAHQSIGSWMGQLVGYSAAPTTTQTQLCLDCHQATMSPATATFAHNQQPEQLKLRTQLVANRPSTQLSLTDAFIKTNFNPTHELSCSTCHREHHGQQVDMKAMTDLQCQSCHVQSIDHFETSHPEFSLQAGSRTPSINFDHKSHGRKHFVQANQSFDCAVCHKDDTTGNVKQMVSYENACANCHDGALKLSSQKGIVFFQLPMIDPEAIQTANVDLGSWPSDLSLDFDGEISGITRILLEADPQARQAFYLLGEDQAWVDLDPDSTSQMEAVANILLGLKRLLVDLSARGNEAVRQRLQVALQRKLSSSQTDGLVHGMSSDLFRDARQRWFPNLLKEIDLETCFPIFDPHEQTAIRPIVFSSQFYGKLDPRFVQDVLAENPLQGQFENPNQEPLIASEQQAPKKSLPLQNTPVQQPSIQNRSSQDPVGNPSPVASGDLLAENPLAGPQQQFQSRTIDQPAAQNMGKTSQLQLPNQDRASLKQLLPSSDGDLLAENPLANQFKATPNADDVPEQPTTENYPSELAEQNPAGSHPTASDTNIASGDAVEDLQRVDEILAKFGQTQLSSSGWRRDDSMFSVSYQLTGHADPWLQHWIQLAADEKMNVGSGQQTALVLFNHLASATSSGNCMQCHVAAGDLPTTPVDHPDNLMAISDQASRSSSARDKDIAAILRAATDGQGKIQFSSSQVNKMSPPTQLAPFRQISATLSTESVSSKFSWKAKYRDPMVRQFTNFNHRPHTLQSGLTDCQSCHQMIEPIGSETRLVLTGSGSDFYPMTRNNCSSCHRSEGTSDQCTTCHSYHVGSRRLK